jgi:hypothetical protein
MADEFIEAQLRETGEMDQLIADLEKTPVPSNAPDVTAKQ